MARSTNLSVKEDLSSRLRRSISPAVVGYSNSPTAKFMAALGATGGVEVRVLLGRGTSSRGGQEGQPLEGHDYRMKARKASLRVAKEMLETMKGTRN